MLNLYVIRPLSYVDNYAHVVTEAELKEITLTSCEYIDPWNFKDTDFEHLAAFLEMLAELNCADDPLAVLKTVIDVVENDISE